MSRRRLTGWSLVALLWSSSLPADDAGQLMLRATPANVQAIAQQYGLEVLREATTAEGHLAVVRGPELMAVEQVEALIQGDPRIASSERIQLASLPGIDPAGLTPVLGDVAVDLMKTGQFSAPCISQGFATEPWSGYADQEAARLIRLQEAQLEGLGCGSVIVAVIDTGVDPDHEMLADALVPGYDFLLEQPGIPSEWDFLDQSLQPILEQSLQPILEQSLQPILEQSLQPILEATLVGEAEALPLGASMAVLLDHETIAMVEGIDIPPFFGHGTMVAGVVRLAAPGARIMPLRVFDGSGSANLFDIVHAVYYAVEHGAEVINMSFSMPEHSSELQRALQYARSQGVVCVAAAGNEGERTHVYPAAFGSTVGVAATDLDDQLSVFSSYGSALVDLAAPGSGIVSTYPGGLFAAGWGTSFSAPLVAGTAALIRHRYLVENGGTVPQLTHDLEQGAVVLQDLAGDVGSGRLDMLATVQSAPD